jgi:hypothetical protein
MYKMIDAKEAKQWRLLMRHALAWRFNWLLELGFSH